MGEPAFASAYASEHPGEDVNIALYWQATAKPEDDYTVFIPSGTYPLRIGFCDPAIGQRLPVLSEAGISMGDSVLLPFLYGGYPQPMVTKRSSRLLMFVLGGFLALGVVYSLATPIFEASDELWHYPLVKYIADGHGLPVQRPGVETMWRQEGSQPPAYYVLAALLTGWIDTDDLPEVRWLNPLANIGNPLAPDNKNMVIHTDREAFPWRGTALAVHLIRVFSVLLGAGTILCTYTIAFWLFPGRPAIAVAAMAFNAFLPMFIFISASVNNDNLVIFLSSLSLVLLMRVIRRGATPWLLLGLGALIGLACLAKLSALGLLPLACLALALRSMRAHRDDQDRPWFSIFTRWVGECALVIVPAVLIAGWWYARNWQLYGDLLGLNAMVAIAGGRPPLRTLSDLLGEFRGFRYSFWGVLGGFNILLRPAWVYLLLDLLSVAALVGLAAWAWRTWRRRTPAPWPELLLLAAWIGVEAVALLRWTSVTLASQGRLMFAALTAICLFLALGLIGWLPPRRQRIAAWGVGGLLFLLAASVPFTAIRPAYVLAPLLTAADVPASAQRFDVDYGGAMRLLAFEVGKDPRASRRCATRDALLAGARADERGLQHLPATVRLAASPGPTRQLSRRRHPAHQPAGSRPGGARHLPHPCAAGCQRSGSGLDLGWAVSVEQPGEAARDRRAGQAGRLPHPGQDRAGHARTDADRRASAHCRFRRPRAADRL